MSSRPSVIGGSAQAESPEWMPGLLDVLHDPAEEQFLAVEQRVHVKLDGIVEELVHEHGMLRAHVGKPAGAADVTLQGGVVVDDLHAAAAEHVGRPHQHRIADLVGDRLGLGVGERRAVPWRGQARRGEQPAERAAFLGQVDGVRAGAGDRHPCLGEPAREAERRLPAELHDDPGDRARGLLGVHHLEHVLEGERLEVQPVRGVVVGGHRLRVAVDHHGLVAGRGQRERGVHARVVELDALPDAVRAAAEDDHLRHRAIGYFALLVIRRIQVRGAGGELGSAGIDRLVDGPDAERTAKLARDRLRHPAQLADLSVGEAEALGGKEHAGS